MKLKNRFEFIIAFSLILLLALSYSAFTQNTNDVTVNDVFPGEVNYKGFSLSQDSKIMVSGSAADYERWDEGYVFYGWILDSKTRKAVWHLLESDESRKGRRGDIYEYNEEINLPKGDYEVYFTAMSNNVINIRTFGDAISSIFRSRRSRGYSWRDREKLGITVSGPASVLREQKGHEYADKLSEQAIVSFIRAGDREHFEKGFSLKSDTKIHIYSLGEIPSRDLCDYAWIYDVANRRRVWSMDYRFNDYAGGGEKNVLVDEEITLPAGSYMVYYVTDDCHSFDEWNVMPPDDPQFWGVTLWAATDRDMANVIPFKESEVPKPAVELTHARDDDFLSQGITLKKDMDLRILCVGEGSGNLVDYGWIIDADTRETVWEMTRRRTEHAGGADKNRMVDEVMRFDKGNYIVFYQTDDSHSYRDWNAAAPYDPESWGITVWPEDRNNMKYIETFDERDFKSDKILAEIVRVRDHEFLSETFELDKETKVRVLAIGEGDSGEMYDFGWIENADNRRIVWDMTYRISRHAGGARKNRLVSDVIVLPKGKYKVFYETDDSHSYHDWNSSPPYDQDRYGITVMIEK